MSIPFPLLDSSDFVKATCEAGKLLHNAAPKNRPWSTVELRFAEAEYAWLQEWLRHARCCDALGQVTWNRATRDAVGLILHCLYAEKVRRDGSFGAYWPHVRALWPADASHTHDWFISGSDDPTSLQREVLKQSARSLKLRHAFDDNTAEETQEWYTTGFLQLGFPRRSFLSKLPEWLTNHPMPVAMQRLQDDPLDASFRDLMARLTAWRHDNNTTESTLRAQLRGSPWVLPDWHDALLKQAKARPALNAANGAPESSETASPLAFLGTPALRFTGEGKPQFTVPLENLASLELTAPEYTLRLGEKTLTKLVRQPDGAYASVSGATLVLPWHQPEVVLDLIDPAKGTMIESRSLTLWDANAWVNVFSAASGERFESTEQLALGNITAVHALCGAELLVAPDSCPGQQMGAWRWLRGVPVTTDLTLTFPDDDSPYWSLQAARRQPDPRAESFTPGAVARATLLSGAPLLTLRFCAWPKGATLLRASLDRAPLDVEKLKAGAGLSLTSTPEQWARPLRLDIKVRLADGFVFRKNFPLTAELAASTVLWKNHAGEVSLGTRPRFLVNTATNHLVSYEHRGRVDTVRCHWALEESRRRLRGVPPGWFKVPSDLSGLGEPLEIYPSAFNTADPIARLADCVLDTGMLGAAVYDTAATSLRIRLEEGRDRLADEVRWYVLSGTPGTPPRFEPLPDITYTPSEDSHSGYYTAPALAGHQYYAVAAAMGETCLGAAWVGDANLRSALLQNGHADMEPTLRVQNARQAEHLAAALRVMKAPIRSREDEKALVRFLSAYSEVVMPLWMGPAAAFDFGDGLPLRPRNPNDRAWQMAAGALYRKVERPISLSMSETILARYGYRADEPGCQTNAFAALTDHSPALAARCIRALYPAEGPQAAFAAHICRGIAGQLNPTDRDITEAIQDWTDQPSIEFIHTVLDPLAHGTVPDGAPAANLRTLLSLPTPVFRRRAMKLTLDFLLAHPSAK